MYRLDTVHFIYPDKKRRIADGLLTGTPVLLRMSLKAGLLLLTLCSQGALAAKKGVPIGSFCPGEDSTFFSWEKENICFSTMFTVKVILDCC